MNHQTYPDPTTVYIVTNKELNRLARLGKMLEKLLSQTGEVFIRQKMTGVLVNGKYAVGLIVNGKYATGLEFALELATGGNVALKVEPTSD